MTDHPLTDEMIRGIWDKVGNAIVDAKDEDLDGKFIEDALIRTAYDLAVEQITEQWEEVINSPRTDIQMIREFDKRLRAMRPLHPVREQQEEL